MKDVAVVKTRARKIREIAEKSGISHDAIIRFIGGLYIAGLEIVECPKPTHSFIKHNLSSARNASVSNGSSGHSIFKVEVEQDPHSED
jgi:hypothetical protein